MIIDVTNRSVENLLDELVYAAWNLGITVEKVEPAPYYTWVDQNAGMVIGQAGPDCVGVVNGVVKGEVAHYYDANCYYAQLDVLRKAGITVTESEYHDTLTLSVA